MRRADGHHEFILGSVLVLLRALSRFNAGRVSIVLGNGCRDCIREGSVEAPLLMTGLGMAAKCDILPALNGEILASKKDRKLA